MGLSAYLTLLAFLDSDSSELKQKLDIAAEERKDFEKRFGALRGKLNNSVPLGMIGIKNLRFHCTFLRSVGTGHFVRNSVK